MEVVSFFLSVAQCCLLNHLQYLGVDGQGIGCLDLVGARQSTLNTCFADLNVVVWCLGRGASGLFYGNTIDMSPFWWWWS